jgi:hypothetical protein
MLSLTLYRIKFACSALVAYYLTETESQARTLFEEQFGEHIRIESITSVPPGFVCVTRK